MHTIRNPKSRTFLSDISSFHIIDLQKIHLISSTDKCSTSFYEESPNQVFIFFPLEAFVPSRLSCSFSGCTRGLLRPLTSCVLFSCLVSNLFDFCFGSIPLWTERSISSISSGDSAFTTIWRICSFSAAVKFTTKDCSADAPSPGVKVFCCPASSCISLSSAAPAADAASRFERSRSF